MLVQFPSRQTTLPSHYPRSQTGAHAHILSPPSRSFEERHTRTQGSWHSPGHHTAEFSLPRPPDPIHAKHIRWRNSGAVKTKLYLLVFTATRAPSALAANLPSKTLPIPPSFRRGLTTLCHAFTVSARPCVCTKEKLLEKHSS